MMVMMVMTSNLLNLNFDGEPWESFPAPFAGVDEAGRGCLAGPVAACAVILPARFDLPGLNDSKKLTPAKRAKLEGMIKSQALAWGAGLSWPREIDRINILRATLAAMRRAVMVLKLQPVFLAVDGDKKAPVAMPQTAIKGGDGIVPAISAASILAKTFRDRLMTIFDKRYPGYGLARHKGYGAKAHLEAIKRLGPCPLHRMTFKGVRKEDESAGPGELWLPGV